MKLGEMDHHVRVMHTRSGLLEAINARDLPPGGRPADPRVPPGAHPEARTVPLCGNSIGTDRRFLSTQLPRSRASSITGRSTSPASRSSAGAGTRRSWPRLPPRSRRTVPSTTSGSRSPSWPTTAPPSSLHDQLPEPPSAGSGDEEIGHAGAPGSCSRPAPRCGWASRSSSSPSGAGPCWSTSWAVACGAQLDDVVVILGADHELIDQRVDWAAPESCVNPDHASGMSTSLRVRACRSRFRRRARHGHHGRSARGQLRACSIAYSRCTRSPSSGRAFSVGACSTAVYYAGT